MWSALFFFFFFNDTATTEIYTLSLHDALPILSILFTVYDRHKNLKQEKKILTLEQDMLRSQMNPHFLFNSLNSIKLYIINNEKENAVYYLNKFAKLIRKILAASSEKEIPLSDELRSEEHTSELQSRRNLVCRLLLEKKNIISF